MTAKDFRACLDALRLTQVAAAPKLGSDARTVRRWALGERPVPVPIQLLLAALIQLDGTVMGG